MKFSSMMRTAVVLYLVGVVCTLCVSIGIGFFFEKAVSRSPSMQSRFSAGVIAGGRQDRIANVTEGLLITVIKSENKPSSWLSPNGLLVEEHQQEIPYWARAEWVDTGTRDEILLTREFGFGFPMRAMAGSMLVRGQAVVACDKLVVLSQSPLRIIPTRILWYGALINGAILGVVFGVVILVFKFGHSRIRNRRVSRGLCPRCAYPRGVVGSVVGPCSECGQPA